jgi:hypothetical protein
MNIKTTLLALLGTCLVSIPVCAQDSANVPTKSSEETEQPAVEAKPDFTKHFPTYGFGIAPRYNYLVNKGAEPYLKHPWFIGASLSGSIAVWKHQRMVLRLIPTWSIQGTTSTARGADTNLVINHLNLGIRPEYHFSSTFFGFANMAPGAAHVYGVIKDTSINQELSASSWTWSFDLTAGASYQLFNVLKDKPGRSGLWVTGDVGYSFAGQATMIHNVSKDSDDPRQYGELTMPPLRPAGILWRIGLEYLF